MYYTVALEHTLYINAQLHCFWQLKQIVTWIHQCCSIVVLLAFDIIPTSFLSQMIDEFTDVNKGEKELMKLWNLFAMEEG
jgi:hypothetical protein